MEHPGEDFDCRATI